MWQKYFAIKCKEMILDALTIGLSPIAGMMLPVSQKTGMLVGVLLDEGLLSNVRPAAAGQIGARCPAPCNIRRVGVLGTGIL